MPNDATSSELAYLDRQEDEETLLLVVFNVVKSG